MNVQTDPLQSIVTALRGIFVQPNQFQDVMLGWPDTKFFDVDGNLPIIAVVEAGITGKHLTSRENVHASVTDVNGNTATVYTEQLRLYYLLQLSIFTNTPQDRSNLGWIVQQYLTTNPQMSIGTLGVETAVWTFKGLRDAPGETKFYQRDLTFEVTARVLDAQQSVPIMKTFTANDNT